MRIKLLHTANCALGRAGQRPEAIVLHVTEGSSESAIKWCMNPISKVSYHYIVDECGEITEMVNPENTAWANGLVVESSWNLKKEGINPNQYTISIAYAGTAEAGPTRAQVIAIAELVREMSDRYKIPLDKFHVVGHYIIRTDKTCPGRKMPIECVLALATLD